jgi:two-component system sensor histidine kinase EvgS
MRIFNLQGSRLGNFYFSLASLLCTFSLNAFGIDTPNLTASNKIRYSIHEHHKPLLLLDSANSDINILGRLIDHLETHLNLKFIPVWRKGASTGEKELLRGEVDFIMDPPKLLIGHFPEELTTQYVFQSQGVVVKKLNPQNTLSHPTERIAYLSGIADFSEMSKGNAHDSWIAHQSLNDIYRSFTNDQIDSAVLPLRLIQYHLSGGLNLNWFIDGLYGNDLANYQWIFHPSKKDLKKILETEISAWQFKETAVPIKKNQTYSENFIDQSLQMLSASTLIPLCMITLLMLSWIWKLRRERLKIIQETNVLAESNSQAIKANEAKSNFLATVSHEIRTPMHAILGVQELLIQSDTIKSEDRSLLQSAQNAAKSLLEVLNQVLDISKFEAGKLQIKERPTDLHALLNCTMQPFETLANKQNITCQLCVDENLAKSLLLDDLRLRQVIQNLLSNSIKFTQEGYVSISCKVLNNTHAEQFIEISVADTGIGITNTEIERLLKPYEQSKVNDLSTIPGTGLGLSITSELLKSLGSELILDSQMGLGTTASFNLKLKRSTAKALNRVKHVARAQPFRSMTHRKTILIVDDHEASREVLRVQVEQLGYKSVLAHDAREAIDLANMLKPEILITDESMPGISGRELAKRIRTSFPEIKIIGLTADVFAQQQQSKYIEAGMNCVLVKPISLNQLEKHLNANHLIHQKIQMTHSWNIEFLEKLTGQDEQLKLKIIKAIFDVQEEFILRINNDEKVITPQELKSWAHKIRGGSQMIDAKRVESACLHIESSVGHSIQELIQAVIENNQELHEFLEQKTTLN